MRGICSIVHHPSRFPVFVVQVDQNRGEGLYPQTREETIEEVVINREVRKPF